MKANKHEIKGYIYVTSGEEIKVNDYILSKDSISPLFVDGISIYPQSLLHNHWHKIILCNNPNLPIQQLSTEEVEYLKSVDSFEVDKAEHGMYKDDVYYKLSDKIFYKIIIPQETECKFIGDCENKCLTHCLEKTLKHTDENGKTLTFLGGKEQPKQTLYTEDEVLELLKLNNDEMLGKCNWHYVNLIKWFNKHKKQ